LKQRKTISNYFKNTLKKKKKFTYHESRLDLTLFAGQLVEPHVIGGRTTLAPNHTPSFNNAIYTCDGVSKGKLSIILNQHDIN
jgi:hypothetical protein